MVMSLVPQVKLQDVRLVLLAITAQRGPEVILPTGISKDLLVMMCYCGTAQFLCFENFIHFIILLVFNFKEPIYEYWNQMPMDFTTIDRIIIIIFTLCVQVEVSTWSLL